jgi:hypothetical protein
MIWVCNTARMDERRDAYMVLLEKPEGKKSEN